MASLPDLWTERQTALRAPRLDADWRCPAVPADISGATPRPAGRTAQPGSLISAFLSATPIARVSIQAPAHCWSGDVGTCLHRQSAAGTHSRERVHARESPRLSPAEEHRRTRMVASPNGLGRGCQACALCCHSAALGKCGLAAVLDPCRSVGP